MAFRSAYNRRTLGELMHDNKRLLDQSITAIERERQALQSVEEKLILVINKSAKQHDMVNVRVIAKELIRTRCQIVNFSNLISELECVSHRLKDMKSTVSMEYSVREAIKTTMETMKEQMMKLPASLERNLTLEKENEKMRFVNDVVWILDMGDEGDEEQVNDLVDEMMGNNTVYRDWEPVRV